MDETIWMEATDPADLLEVLTSQGTHRRWTLLAVAFCRRLEPLLAHEASRMFIDVCERYADRRKVSMVQLAEAYQRAASAARELLHRPPPVVDVPQGVKTRHARKMIGRARAPGTVKYRSARAILSLWSVATAQGRYSSEKAQAWRRVGGLLSRVTPALKKQGRIEGFQPEQTIKRERLHQCALIRCLVANPYLKWEFAPEWGDWAEGTPRRIARTIYDEGRFEELPILGDALADAGCTDRTILRHCHEDRIHARGCYVVDALLGKN